MARTKKHDYSGKLGKARLVREVGREQYARTLAELRRRIAHLAVELRHALARLRDASKRARRIQSAALKRYRSEQRARIKAHCDALRSALRVKLSARKEAIRARYASSLDRAHHELRAHKSHAKALARVAKHAERKVESARVARRESDDEVRGNLPADLVPVWTALGRKLPSKAKKSRTEGFLDWVEENPEEVLRWQADRAQKLAHDDLRKMRADERAMSARLRKGKGLGYSRAELEGLERLGIDPLAGPKKVAHDGPTPF